MTLFTGTRLGPYEVLAPLGTGGMGEVYRAKDSKLRRDVAIKVLSQSRAANPDALARFEREALAVAALSHPNILSIFDFGTQDGISYAVMELLEGETLRGKLDAAPISQKQAVDYALQVAKGLSAAHEKGIVHRDLKPENLFVSRDGHLKILDFGLAKRTELEKAADATSLPTQSKHTEAGVVMGTVAYMSPEQVRGLPVDHRSDIFSFGAILYELLSGKKAFQKDTAADTMSAILKEEPPELTKSGRNISPSLDHVVKHSLEKDRSNRFQSAKDIVFALSEASGKAMASGAKPATRSTGKRKVIVRRTQRVGIDAGGVKRLAVLPFENLGAVEDEYFADGLTDEVRGKLAELSGLAVIASASASQYKTSTKPPEQIAEELGVGYLLVARVRWQKSGKTSRIRITPELVEVGGGGAPTARWQQAFDADLSDVFRVQVEIATKVAQSLEVVLSGQERGRLETRPTSNLAAYDAYLKGLDITKDITKGRIGGMRPAVAKFEEAVALDPGFALAWANVSIWRSGLYATLDPSPREAEAARVAAERAVELAPELPKSNMALSLYYSRVKQDYARALEVISRALKFAPWDAGLLRGIAAAEQVLGRWNEALAHLHQALDLDRRSNAAEDSLGYVLLVLRRTGEARKVCDRGLALAPGDLWLLLHKAMTYLQEGHLAEARTVMAGASKRVGSTDLVSFFALLDLDWVLDDAEGHLLLRLTPGAFNDDRGRWAICLAQASARRSDQAKVREYAEEARKAFATQVAEAPDEAERHALLGLSLAYLGHKEEAAREGKRGVALLPVSKNAIDGPYMQHHLVRIQILSGRHAEALDLLEPLLKVPYYLTPDWLRIDPNFDPLRKNPRFQKLVAPT